MRAERLKWCIEHQHWTLEDWKNVIWSDETSVVLLHRRGGYRVWRQPSEAFLRSTIRERWKGSSEFLFWGCFSYEKKGPSHCWQPETAQEKKEAEKAIVKWNEELEPILQQEWELSTQMRRLNIRRQQPGKRPSWRWNSSTGKLIRNSKGGVDWYRYQMHILLPKLLPFAQECLRTRPSTVVQEDRAPAHSHYIQQRVFDAAKVRRLIWCPNSPDLNAIEPAWPYLKRATTKLGGLPNRKTAIEKWTEEWANMPQEKVQAWNGFLGIFKRLSGLKVEMSTRKVGETLLSVLVCRFPN
jgi:hypothetical protein